MMQSSSVEQSSKRILIACIGNIFFGDDGFGVAVAQRLQNRQYPAGVQAIDFGIRGIELAYTLLDGYDAVVLVDAVPRGGTPGTLYVIEPDVSGDGSEQRAGTYDRAPDGHSMNPVNVLALARVLGMPPTPILLVGCEPSTTGIEEDEMQMGLSAPVEAAIDEAVCLIDEVVASLRG